MTVRLLITSAVALVFAGPAFADCMQEIESLSEAVTQAETGASSADTGLPATQHQEEVLAGSQQGNTAQAGASDAGEGKCLRRPISSRRSHSKRIKVAGSSQPISLLRRAIWSRLVTRKAACRR